MVTIIENPPNHLFYIAELFAFISEDDLGNEGVCGIFKNGVFTAMVGADMQRINSLMPFAQEIADTNLKKVKLVKFSTRTEVTNIEPKG